MRGAAVDPYRPVFEAASEHLVAALGRARYQQWFRDAAIERVDARAVRLAVPTDVHRTWLEAVYGEALREAFDRVLGPGTAVEVVVSPRLDATRIVRDAMPEDERAWQKALAERRPAPSFLTFVPEDAHRFALGLLEQVLHGGSGPAPRSVYLFGESGSGKTHLLEALRGALAGRTPASGLYLTAREYTRRVVQAVRAAEPGGLQRVEDELVARRVVLLDGLDELEPRPRTQHALEALLDRGGADGLRLVLAGRRAPHAMTGLSERLRSRLLSGVAVRVSPPGPATLPAILGARAAAFGVTCPPELSTAILARGGSVASACALLDRWALLASRLEAMAAGPLDLAWLDDLAPPASPSSPREEVARRAKRVVTEHFGLERRALDRASKQPATVFPRQVAMYLLWRSAALPLDAVARAFGLRSHSAASRAIQEVRARRDADPSVETLLEGLIARL